MLGSGLVCYYVDSLAEKEWVFISEKEVQEDRLFELIQIRLYHWVKGKAGLNGLPIFGQKNKETRLAIQFGLPD